MTHSARLTPLDAIENAWKGIAARAPRSALAALGIAVGVAAIVALTGVSESNRLALLAQLDHMGANLLTVQGKHGPSADFVPLPSSALDSIRRQRHVAAVGAFEVVPDGLKVYRNDLLPAGETNGISVRSATKELASALDMSVRRGRWFDEASRATPTVVLGSEAAARLGIEEPGFLVFIGGEWYQVIGILHPVALVPEVDTSAILGDQWVREHYPAGPLDPSPKVGEADIIYVQATPGNAEELRKLLATAASPGSSFVQVSRPSDLAQAREATDDSLSKLGLALGSIALLVGGVGIANTMVVTVMQRRGEIGLRQALGARRGQIMFQFMVESTAISLLGAVAGVVAGIAGSLLVSATLGQPAALPWLAAAFGVGASALVGTVAGLSPAARAARVPPNEALRSA